MEDIKVMPQGDKQVTIYDIAKAAGVSTATVSRAMNGSPKVTEKTRKKIEAVMQEYHYVANTSAKSLANNRSYLMGILIPDLHNVHYLDAAETISAFFESYGFACITSAAGEYPTRHEKALKMLAARKIDCLALVGAYFNNDIVKNAIRNYFSNIPVMLMYGHMDIPNVISVYVDEEEAADEATKLLIHKGYRNLVFVKMGDSTNIRHKGKGFLKACEEEGLQGRFWNITAQKGSVFAIADSITEMLHIFPETDGVVFSNDYLAMIGGRAIQDLGKKVPEEVAYISFYNCSHSYTANPRISSVDTRIRDLAELGCNLIMEAFGKPKENVSASLPYKIVEKETT